jgi:hypothetical protein
MATFGLFTNVNKFKSWRSKCHDMRINMRILIHKLMHTWLVVRYCIAAYLFVCLYGTTKSFDVFYSGWWFFHPYDGPMYDAVTWLLAHKYVYGPSLDDVTDHKQMIYSRKGG